MNLVARTLRDETEAEGRARYFSPSPQAAQIVISHRQIHHVAFTITPIFA